MKRQACFLTVARSRVWMNICDSHYPCTMTNFDFDGCLRTKNKLQGIQVECDWLEMIICCACILWPAYLLRTRTWDIVLIPIVFGGHAVFIMNCCCRCCSSAHSMVFLHRAASTSCASDLFPYIILQPVFSVGRSGGSTFRLHCCSEMLVKIKRCRFLYRMFCSS